MSSSKDSERVPSVVLVVGGEAVLRDPEVASIRAAVLGDGPADFNEDRFDFRSAGTDGTKILDALRTLPILSERRLVWVRGVEDRRAKKFLDNELPGYLEAPEASACLLLEASSVDRRLSWVKAFRKSGEIRECTGPRKPQEIRAWIEGQTRAREKQPERGVASALLDALGPDLTLLQAEIEKLCLFVGDRPEIQSEDVAELTAQLRPHALYELTEAMGHRALGPSLKLIGRLLDQGEAPLVLLGALGNHFRRLMRARECRPVAAREIQKRLSIHPFAAEKLAEQAQRFDGVRLRRCLDAVRRTDDALKGGASLAPRMAIERLVLAVCS